MQNAQPKITQKMLVRTAVALFLLAAFFMAYQWLNAQGSDIDLPAAAETDGMISAIELLSDGSQAVLFNKDGSKRASPGYRKGANDRDLIWRPDGNRLFFSSDRDQSALNIYRWNPGGDTIERRTFGRVGKSAPSFYDGDTSSKNANPLMVFGGMVWELDPHLAKARQLVPVGGTLDVGSQTQTEEAQVSATGGGADVKVRVAKWAKGGRWIAIIRKTEDGEQLAIQKMDGPKSPLIPVIAGDKLAMDINPKTGVIVYCCQNLQISGPEAERMARAQHGKVVKPWIHGVGIVDPDDAKAGGIVIASNDDRVSFTSPTFSPDGSMLILVDGAYDRSGDLTPRGLVLIPAVPNGGTQGVPIIPGLVYEPSWHPNGDTVIFAMRVKGGKRAIYTINRNGSGLKNVSGGIGDFSNPHFSPQTK